MKNSQVLDWADLAFSSKSSINDLKVTFLVAPREISLERFKQIIKTYLPAGNLLLGISKEPFVSGFEDQPQFRMLKLDTINKIIEKVNNSDSKYKIYVVHYFQRELEYLLTKLSFRKVILVNGSWQHAFHTTKPYYILINRKLPYELIPAFTDEKEAKAYEKTIDIADVKPKTTSLLNEKQLLDLTEKTAHYSFDYNSQTGLVLAKHTRDGYKVLLKTFNKVVPFQTYALLNGAEREKHFSPPHDLNHYDTVHAEVEALLEAQKHRVSLEGTTIFINLLPCPTCSRMLADSPIKEIVYKLDHSDGYGARVLQLAGKKVRRVV